MASPNPVEEAVRGNDMKRRRVSVACANCRARKSRCNGARPKCSTCLSNGYECLYEQPSGPNISAHRESTCSNTFLEARVTELENLLRSRRNSEWASERSVRSNHSNSMRKPGSILTRRRVSTLQSSGGSQPFSTGESISDQSGEPQGENVDGLASIVLEERDDYDSEGRYFGGASNISLIHLITSQLPVNHDPQLATTISQANGHRLPPRTSADLGHAHVHVPGPNESIEVDPLIFPSGTKADQLIHVYFSTIHLFVPCLDERSFLNKYKACQKATRPSAASVSGAWLGSFYVVLSLACQCLEARSPESNWAAESEIYYRKALNAGMKQAIYGTGFEVVQFLVLLTAYLQGTHRSTESWTFHSLAVKSALQIALYSKRSQPRLTASEKILRQRCWLCLVFNDRIMSIAYGRPGLIQRTYGLGDVPLENIDELAPIHVTKKVAFLSSLHFRELMSLSTIAADIADLLNASSLDGAPKSTVSVVVGTTVEALGRLSLWRSQLPASLQILSPNDLPEPKVSGNLELYSTRFRVFLSLRYLSTQILAYRAILDLLLKDSDANEDSANQTKSLGLVALALLEDCAQCCRLVIDITKTVVRVSAEGVNINGAWWLSAHFVLNSSLVLLGVNLAIRHANSRSSQPQLSNSSIENRQSIDDAAAVMQGLDRGNAVIARCMHVLLHFTRLYDASDIFQQEQSSMGSHPPEFPPPNLAHQNIFMGDGNPFGNSNGMGSLFDEFAGVSNFNFLSDSSYYG